MKYLSQKPSVDTFQTAEEIIGEGLIDAFYTHYTASTSGTGTFPDKEINEALGGFASGKQGVLTLRNIIAEKYKELRKAGYFPDGLKTTGGINFRTALKSAVCDKIETSLADDPGTVISEGMTDKQKQNAINSMKQETGRLFKTVGVI